jgi:hypothetical protein
MGGKIDMAMKTKFAIDMQAQILNTIYSQYKGISESLLLIQNVHLSGKRDFSNFTEMGLHKIFRIPFIYTINICL